LLAAELNRTSFENLQLLVLDEVQSRPQAKGVLELLPPAEERQTVVVTAGLPDEIWAFCRLALQPNYLRIEATSGPLYRGIDQAASGQFFAVLPQEDMAGVLWNILQRERWNGLEDKVVVFFTTPQLAVHYAEVFRKVGLRINAVHRALAQDRFDDALDLFQASSSGIWFIVEDQGLEDYDGYAMVHFGAPFQREAYESHIGASFGGEDRSILLLHDFEYKFVGVIEDLLTDILDRRDLLRQTPPLSLAWPSKPKRLHHAFEAWVAHYHRVFKNQWSVEELQQHAAEFARSIGGMSEEDGSLPQVRADRLGRRLNEAFNTVSEKEWEKLSESWAEESRRKQMEVEDQRAGKIGFWRMLNPTDTDLEIQKAKQALERRKELLQKRGLLEEAGAELLGQYFKGEVIEAGQGATFGWVHCPELMTAFQGRYVYLDQKDLRKTTFRMKIVDGMRASFTLGVDRHGNPVAEEVGLGSSAEEVELLPVLEEVHDLQLRRHEETQKLSTHKAVSEASPAESL